MPIDEAVQNAMRVSATYVEQPGMAHSGFQLAPATLPTTYAAGDLDVDAAGLLYSAKTSAIRGLIPANQLVRQKATFTLTNGTSAQNIFTAAQDTLTVEAATVYYFRMYVSLTTGATSHTTSLAFDAGTATMTSFNYLSTTSTGAASALAAPEQKEVEVATVIAVSAATTAVRQRVYAEGIFETLAAGTLIPQLKFSADPTGTLTTNIGSFMLIQPIGVAAMVSVGPWA